MVLVVLTPPLEWMVNASEAFADRTEEIWIGKEIYGGGRIDHDMIRVYDVMIVVRSGTVRETEVGIVVQ